MISIDLDLFVNWPFVAKQIAPFFPEQGITGIVVEYLKSPLAWDQKKYTLFYNKEVELLPMVHFDIDAILRGPCPINPYKQVGHTHAFFPIPRRWDLVPAIHLFEHDQRRYEAINISADPWFHWCLMPLIPLGRDAFKDLNKQIAPPYYEMPNIADVVAGFYIANKLNHPQLNLATRCKETVSDLELMARVENSADKRRLSLTIWNHREYIEDIVPLRKFYPERAEGCCTLQ